MPDDATETAVAVATTDDDARREAWLRGPTEEEKLEWAIQERARRTAERDGQNRTRPSNDARWVAQRYVRGAQLAAEVALSLLFHASARDLFEQLVRAGRNWESEFTSRPTTARRIGMDTARVDRARHLNSDEPVS
jgi:hypothetical protein